MILLLLVVVYGRLLGLQQAKVASNFEDIISVCVMLFPLKLHFGNTITTSTYVFLRT